MKISIILLLTFFLFNSTSQAEIYKYRDESGTFIFTNDISKVPQNKVEKQITTNNVYRKTKDKNEKIIGKWVAESEDFGEYVTINDDNTGNVYDGHNNNLKITFKWEKISENQYKLVDFGKDKKQIVFNYENNSDRIIFKDKFSVYLIWERVKKDNNNLNIIGSWSSNLDNENEYIVFNVDKSGYAPRVKYNNVYNKNYFTWNKVGNDIYLENKEFKHNFFNMKYIQDTDEIQITNGQKFKRTNKINNFIDKNKIPIIGKWTNDKSGFETLNLLLNNDFTGTMQGSVLYSSFNYEYQDEKIEFTINYVQENSKPNKNNKMSGRYDSKNDVITIGPDDKKIILFRIIK